MKWLFITVAGLAAYAAYKYSRMSEEEKQDLGKNLKEKGKNLKEKGKKLYDIILERASCSNGAFSFCLWPLMCCGSL